MKGQPDSMGAAPYELFMLGLSAYVIAALAAEVVLPLNESTRTILRNADAAICIVFLFDFLRNIYRSEAKLTYLATWGWVDLASSIPLVDALRWGRAARVV